MGYPYSHTVQRELSILVGYLLVLYGRWNTVVKTVYPKKSRSGGINCCFPLKRRCAETAFCRRFYGRSQPGTLGIP